MKNIQHLVDKLDQLVQNAKSGVQLYRQMYSGVSRLRSLDEFAQLPVLTNSILITERLEKTLTDSLRVALTRTFEDSLRIDSYMPKMLSYEDVLEEYKVLTFFMLPVNKKRKHKIMLIADERHIYTISEFGHNLAYFEWPLSAFIIREQSMSALQTHLTWFRPTIIFLDAQQKLPAEMLPDSVKYLFTFNQLNGGETKQASHQSFKRYDILRDAWTGPLAIRASDKPYYRFDSELFFFESSANGALLVTSFINRLQPIIRYKLPYRGLQTGSGKFVLNGSPLR